MKSIHCPFCRSVNIWVQSYEDGVCDYGDGFIAWYECHDCEYTFPEDGVIFYRMIEDEEK